MADHSGFRSIRLAAGLRVQLFSRAHAEFGYLFEPRRSNVGPNRHMFTTLLHFQR
jgi:hypothetical protein